MQPNYRQLDPRRIVETVSGLQSRIEERFPGSGLASVVADLRGVADETVARIAWIQKPNLPLRIGVGLMAAAIVLVSVSFVLGYRQSGNADFALLIQEVSASLSSLVYFGAAILFLTTWETRIKRARALKAIHELRSLAHIIDMHQLTKDPELAFRGDADATTKRALTPFALSRYLDYCSEALSLTGKIAALYLQGFQDPVVLDAVDDVENLTTGLSGKIWQKISVLDLMQRSGNALRTMSG
ncbi:MAG TPA: hypothetical protein VGK20_12670 [Candidatus Binatia bacterium]|jgi:hypothetical protein